MSLRIGELCAGYGGLALGIKSVLDAHVTWLSENDAGACKVLAHRFPGVPNLGDLTTVDWGTAPPVDIFSAGFPCQPVSAAGRRAGIHDERWLFDDILRAIRDLDPPPQLCVLENVPGLLTANNGDAMARIVEGLASIGYMGRYRVLRASAIGAPHRRERVFIVAWPIADPPDLGHQRNRKARQRRPGPTHGDSRCVELLPTPPGRDPKGRNPRAGDPCPTGALLPTPRATDGSKGGPTQRGASGDLMLPSAVQLLPTPTSRDEAASGGSSASHVTLTDATVRQSQRWGTYAAAITRWEQLTRTAPEPTEPTGRNNNHRLSPRFVEWMQGLPDGWVTDVPAITRTEALRALGGGVVPQQCAAALANLLNLDLQVTA